MWVFSATNQLLLPTCVALGNFDGVHLGHQTILRGLVKTCQRTGGHSAVVSFNPHPRAFFSGQSQSLLTPQAEKAALLSELGVEQLVLLPFDDNLARLSPRDFVERMIVGQLQAKTIAVGADFHFGYQRQGTATDLQRLGAIWGVDVEISALKTENETRISSSRIRAALGEGKIEVANRWLGRPYCLQGTILEGRQLGRRLGFPTANLKLPADKLLPALGVYAAQVLLADSQVFLPGVMNLGRRPTVGKENTITAEVHLLDWRGDLYGQELSVYLHRFLREERKFEDLTALKEQIQRDCQQARQVLVVM
ncbi:MAG: bifunctional riboflavin kinase/FAD synthetase [Cyanobacteriota bacterium]